MKIEEFVKEMQEGLPKFTDKVKKVNYDDTGDPDWSAEEWFDAYYIFVETYGVNPSGISESEAKTEEKESGDKTDVQETDKGEDTNKGIA